MPRGDKSRYTDKHEHKADHIAQSWEECGVAEKEAERRAGASVTRTTAAARTPADRVGENRPAILRRIRVGIRAARPQRPARLPSAQSWRARRPPPASAIRPTPLTDESRQIGSRCNLASMQA
jgi:hypothetical protein